MTKFTLHTPETAPDSEVKASLTDMKQRYGFIPNLGAVLAEAPNVLNGYFALFDALEKGSLLPQERHLAYITASVENKCRYCVAAHSMLAKKMGLSADAVTSVREKTSLSDGKLEAIRKFVSSIVLNRGVVDDSEIDAFLNAGFTKAQVFEVIGIVAAKTLTNYANHLAHTEPNPEFLR